MPKTLGGVVGWLVSTVLVVVVGMFIISKVGFLRNIVNGGGSA